MKITHKKKLGKKFASIMLGALMVVSIPMVAVAKDIDIPTEPTTGWYHSSDTVKQATGIPDSVAKTIDGSDVLSFIDINSNMISVKTEAQLKSALAKSGNKKIRLLANITPRNNISVNGKNIIYLNGYKLNSLAKVKGNAKKLNFCSDVEKESDFTKALAYNNGNYPHRVIIRKAVTLANKKYKINNAKTSIYLNNQNLSIKEGGQIYINDNSVEIVGGSRTTFKSVGNTSNGNRTLIEVAPNKNNIHLRNFNVVASDFYDNAIKFGSKDNSLTLLNMDITSNKSGSTAINLFGTSGNAVSNVKVTSVNIISKGYGLKGNYVSKLMINAANGISKKYSTQKNSINFTNSSYIKLATSSAKSYVCTRSANDNGVYFSNVQKSTIQNITTSAKDNGLVINSSSDIYIPRMFASIDKTDDSTVSVNNSNTITFIGNSASNTMSLKKIACSSSKHIAFNNVDTDNCTFTGTSSNLKFNNVAFKNISINGTTSSRINQFFFCGTTKFTNGFNFTNVTKFESSRDVKLTGGTGKVTNGSYFTLTNMMNTVKSKFVLSNCSKYTPTTLLR